MKAYGFLFVCLLLLAACSNANSNSTEKAAEGGAVDSLENVAADSVAIIPVADTQFPKLSMVEPLESGINIDSLTDCMVMASFTADDFNWRGDNLNMTIYCPYLYDAIDVSLLEVGDTIVYKGEAMPIDTIYNVNGAVIINREYGDENEGMQLFPADGGTYRAVGENQYSVTYTLGRVNVMISPDLVIIDNAYLFPPDHYDTIRQPNNVYRYITEMPEDQRNFSEVQTEVTIQNGQVTQIVRNWVP